jgi:hypothetical protein
MFIALGNGQHQERDMSILMVQQQLIQVVTEK